MQTSEDPNLLRARAVEALKKARAKIAEGKAELLEAQLNDKAVKEQTKKNGGSRAAPKSRRKEADPAGGEAKAGRGKKEKGGSGASTSTSAA